MSFTKLSDRLWGNKSRVQYLMLAAFMLIFFMLGAREIWTQEHRWADIVSGMFYRHDFLHPYLGESRYYDKPLLSYWLIALFALIVGLNTWALRLPSVFGGLLAIGSIYSLGNKLKNKQLGLLSGWLLLTCYYFVFWSRTSSADMLNLAGSLFAVSWYFNKREEGSFLNYTIFFMIVALTALCKGLIGAIVPFIAVGIDVILRKSWHRYLRWSFFLAILPALIIYLLPFVASSYFGGDSYGQNGLYLVYRENILRYFHPFDHQGPFYTYFIYLPLYLLPAAILFLPALIALPARWRTMSLESKWIAWTLLTLFAFFTLSGSRRSYYVLPLVPFAVLFTADWILSSPSKARQAGAAVLIVISYFLLMLVIDILPAWYYGKAGAERFAQTLKMEASKTQSWDKWNIVFLDAESKLSFYLQLPPDIRHYDIPGDQRQRQSAASLIQMWPIVKTKPANTIFVTRKSYVPLIQDQFHGYRLVENPRQVNLPWVKNGETNIPVAFVPEK